MSSNLNPVPTGAAVVFAVAAMALFVIGEGVAGLIAAVLALLCAVFMSDGSGPRGRRGQKSQFADTWGRHRIASWIGLGVGAGSTSGSDGSGGADGGGYSGGGGGGCGGGGS